MCEISVILILNNDLVSPRLRSRANDYRKFFPRYRAFRFEKREDAISTENGGSIHRLRQLTYDEKRLVKKRRINHKVSLLFRKRADRTARRARGTGGCAAGGRGSRDRGGEGAEYKVTSHVYFIPVDPIKVPIIISDVFRCNMFDLVSDIL